jgi:hypothetical protein
MDALDVRELEERFDVCVVLRDLHRVTGSIALLQALADVPGPDGEIVLETYGWIRTPPPRVASRSSTRGRRSPAAR